MAASPHESKIRLLDAMLKVVRTKGYSATRIEDVCAEAGLTKGSFFHHFKSKEDLALAAAESWRVRSIETFAAAPYHGTADALSRLLGYLEFRKALLTGDLPDFTCFAGTIVQEAYRSHPDVSAACARDIIDHAKRLEADIREAMRDHGIRAGWTAESLGRYIMAVIHGALILAKAHGGAAVAAECLDHLQRYIELLFGQGPQHRSGRAPSKRH
jgi:TetR/AcrR family transcriptional repressor of nem operon